MRRFSLRRKGGAKSKRSFGTRIAHWNLRKLTRYVLSVAVILAVVTSWFWYSRVYMDNEQRFWTAISNSMATPSVVRTLTEGGTGNQVIQQYRFHYAPQQVIQNRVEFTQKSATVDTHVVTEGVIFPQDQFLRYTEFVNRSNESELANIDDLLGVWASQGSEDEDESRLNYLSEYVTLVVFGNFTAAQRSDFVDRLRSAYTIDYNSAFSEEVDGEDVLTYSVDVDLRAYVSVLNDSFKAAGYGDFPPLNAENYREGSSLNSVIRVRTRDNAVVGVSFGDRQEGYSNYGVIQAVEVPEANSTIDELQAKVQEQIQ